MPGIHHRFLDERLAKAFSHPLRAGILQRLNEGGVASPKELARALGEPLGNVSYHVRILRELECVELVRTEPRRGALVHFYRATARPWLDDEQWAGLPEGFRRRTLSRTLSEILEQASMASRDGGFDGPEVRVSRVTLGLDQEGLTEISRLLAETLEAVQGIATESASRRAGRGPGTPPTIATQLAMLLFRHGSE
jgi:DNA-binding transcriptional ArsR family regulator